MKNNLTFKKELTKNCEDLIRKLLTKDKSQRITMKEIFSHPWVVSFEKECHEDISTNPSANSNLSINEFKKHYKEKLMKFDIQQDIQRKLSIDEVILEEEGNLFDRVLTKVQTRKKKKQNTTIEKSSLVKSKSDEIKENDQRFLTDKNLPQLKKDFEPKAFNILPRNNTKEDFLRSTLIHNEENNNIYNYEEFGITHNQITLKSPRATETRKLTFPVLTENTAVGNNTVCVNPLKAKKQYLKTAMEILEKAEEGSVVERAPEKKGFWSFLNNFKCGKCD